MHIITNNTAKPITSAAITFAPGENKKRDKDLSPGKIAQIDRHPSLKRVHVDDPPKDESPTQKAKKAETK